MLYPEIVIAGCGNPLFGDDGFGPAVVEELKKVPLPEHIKVVDAGLGGPHFIFTMLDPTATKRLIIIDTADFGAEPGTLATFRVEDLPAGSYRDAHSWDLTEPLTRLKDRIDITVIGCQPKHISAPEFEMGLTDEVKDAVPRTVQQVLTLIGVNYGTAIKHLQIGRQAGETADTCSDAPETS
ncbi:MAG: coenzyme F420-reducing hydrogenase, FrhD protein [Methanomicrobiales archaeon]|nr:coenzyme F420-reducing hydrogenase, FrhD protein [Methanomicrobiales archaeon]